MNTSLPIYNYKKEIIEAIENNAVTIITAETGSGKSTQVPQYVREVGYDVVVTEPRRMAAWSLAQRVAEEMGTELGDLVGFRTGLERNDSENTHILYCTDGLELIRLLVDTNDNKNKVLIIDEVHEWNQNIETLIAWSKKKIAENWCTKVVIMSATLEKETLAQYFETNVCILDVPGKLFPVTFEQRSECDLIRSIIEMVEEKRNTLVFVPGKAEIVDVIEALNFELEKSDIQAILLPLHGELDYSEQKKCFETYSIPKVIVATNVAQTSITIPDIDAVVDTGKERRIEVYNGIEGLFLRNISQADCIQRKGRAGRTKEGRYILCASFYSMEDFSVPEIRRSILDQVVLRLAATGIDAADLEFFHSPKENELKIAKQTLIDLGALTADCTVTEIGYKMAKMPVSAKAARMIVEAEKYGVTEELITIASIMQMGSLLTKNTFYRNFTSEDSSDLLAEMDVWNKLNEMTYIDFKNLGINKKVFYKVKEHIQKLHETLEKVIKITSNPLDRKSIRKACIAGLINHVYIANMYACYEDEQGQEFALDRKSCIFSNELLVGVAKTIEYGTGSYKSSMDLITMGTEVTVQELLDVAPQLITQKEINLKYEKEYDKVSLIRVTYFKGVQIDKQFYRVQDHPEYARLKREYEESEEKYRRLNWKQEEVTIDGKVYKVRYNSYSYPCIMIDEIDLYNFPVENVNLDNGEKVMLKCCSCVSYSLTDLIKTVEHEKMNYALLEKQNRFESIKVKPTLLSILDCRQYLRKMELFCDKKNTLAYCFGCLKLDGNFIKLYVTMSQKEAEDNTNEAVKFMYEKYLKDNYYAKKFKLQKLHKGLSSEEEKAKEQFESECSELKDGLNISNIEERISYLKEFYDMLIEDLKIA